MGTVYLARQKRPMEREIALKVVKPGLDSKQVLARFNYERQALARMDHPGVTDRDICSGHSHEICRPGCMHWMRWNAGSAGVVAGQVGIGYFCV